MKKGKIKSIFKEICSFFRELKPFRKREFLTLRQYEEDAFRNLEYATYCFFAGGSVEEITLKNNLSAYDNISLIPRVLRNVEEISFSTSLLGSSLSFPLIIAPMAFHKLAHSEGEVATAKAVSREGLLMTVSTCSTRSLREIREASSIPPWFQVYVYKDRSITKHLIEKATNLDYGAIVLTVDTPIYGKRLREKNYPLSFPTTFSFPDLLEAGLPLRNITHDQIPKFLSGQIDPSLTWKEIEWVRSLTPLPIILKGVLHQEDLYIAKKEDIKTVILSNHGGRQLDTTISALKALQLLDDTLKADINLILDGGVRKGTDILKGLALGAKALMIGRPILWGLASQGEEGVYNVLKILKEELYLAMVLSGAKSIKDITPEILLKDW